MSRTIVLACVIGFHFDAQPLEIDTKAGENLHYIVVNVIAGTFTSQRFQLNEEVVAMAPKLLSAHIRTKRLRAATLIELKSRVARRISAAHTQGPDSALGLYRP